MNIIDYFDTGMGDVWKYINISIFITCFIISIATIIVEVL